MSSTDFLSKIPRLAGARVLVIGDTMLDRYIYGTVERISPEGPIPVFKYTHEAVSPGGAGNVSRNLAAIGVSAHLIGITGQDQAATRLSDCLADLPETSTQDISEPVTLDLVQDPDRPTIEKIRYIAHRQQMMRCDIEANPDLSPELEAEIIRRIQFALDDTSKPPIVAIALSDYGKSCLGPKVLKTVLAIARKRGVVTIVDPKGTDWARYAGADYITPNRHELSLASGLDCRTDADIEKAARKMLSTCKARGLIVTRSEEGMSLVLANPDSKAQGIVTIPAHAQEVYDVAGAGDTVVASLAAGLGVGMTLNAAVRFANLAAGVVVAKPGTATADLEEILTAATAGRLLDQQDKIASQPQAEIQSKLWHSQGLRIGFTNGCFDLLHPGHISLIKAAKTGCDRLIVAINSDDSVQRLKGPTRPVQNADNRAVVLAALEDVDMVTVFDTDTPLDLINALRPDCLTKGADYSQNEIIGKTEVESWGGEVRRAPLLTGHSTSNLVRKAQPTD